jgi:predicted PurR-regulated permease PerM
MGGELQLRLTNRAILLVLAVLGGVWLLGHATRIMVVLFLAVLVAAAASTVANHLARYRVPRAVAILLTYLALLAILAGLVGLIVPLLGGEFVLLRDNFPRYEDQANALLARLPSRGGAAPRVNDIVAPLAAYAQTAAGDVGRGVRDVGALLVTGLLILVFAFFLAVDERFAQRLVARFLPPAMRERATRLMGRLGTSLGAWVRAQLLVGLFFGAAFGVGLAVLRVPYAATIGTVGAVLEIIPYVGGVVTIALALLMAATTGKLWLLGAVLVWYLVVTNVEAHVVYPKLVGEIVGLQPLVVVLALFLGAEVLGIVGALLAIPVAVVLQTLLDEFYTFPTGTPAGAAEADAAPPAGLNGHGLQLGALPGAAAPPAPGDAPRG